MRIAADTLLAGRYRVIRVIGGGGMGEVYEGHDQDSDRPVAIKVSRSDAPSESVQRLRREVHTLAGYLARIDHPGIVRYIDHGQLDDGAPFLVMEWLEGHDLEAHLGRGPLDVAETITLGCKVAEALAVTHVHGLVHRDIKPGNLFLVGGDEADVKLVDFGLARSGLHPTTLTPLGTLVGTPAYIAPEQARGASDLDGRADLYSLGAVLFACLAGRPPFAGNHLMAILTKLLLEPAPRLCTLRRDVPPALDELVARLLAKQPCERPASADAVRAALAAIELEAASWSRDPGAARAIVSTSEQSYLSLALVGGDGTTAGDVDAALLGELALRYQAHVDRLADGTCIVLFESSRNPVHMAVLAGRFALALQERVPGIAMVLATGRRVISGSGEADGPVIGEVIDRAVKLLVDTEHTVAGSCSMAPPRPATIVACHVTRRLLAQRFRFDGDEHGEDSPPGYRLLGEDLSLAMIRPVLGRITRCVGRDGELARLEALFDRCVEDSAASAVLVTGPPGIGKSRLAHELVARLRQHPAGPGIFHGHGDVMAAGSPLGLLAQILERVFDLTAATTIDERRAWLRQGVAARVASPDAERVTLFLGELLGLSFDDRDQVPLREARGDARLMHDQMRQAWEDWLDAETRVHPVVLVLEDAHWGDAPTLRFLEAALRNLSSSRFLVVALARPEIDEVAAGLRSADQVDRLIVRPLSRRAAAALAREVLADSACDVDIEKLAESCGGNPFFLEEMLRGQVAGDLDRLPDTVLAMVAARLTGLPAAERRFLRAASALGRHFWLDGVAALLGDPPGAVRVLADRVEAAEIIMAQRRSRLPGQSEYAFHHDLAREAAYALLTASDRVTAHQRAGEWLESVGAVEPVVMAEHFRRGKQPGRALPWLCRAAEQALEAEDLDAVLAHSERAIACGACGETLGRLRLLQAEACNWKGKHALALQRGREAMQASSSDSDTWADASQHVAWALGVLGEFDELEALGERIASNHPGTGGWRHLCALATCAGHLTNGGRYTPAHKFRARCDAPLSDGEVPLSVMATLAQVDGIIASHQGALDSLAMRCQEAAELWRRLGNQRKACLCDLNVADALRLMGQYEDAEVDFRQQLAISEQIGVHYMVAYIQALLADVLCSTGRLDEAEQLLRASVAGEAESLQKAQVDAVLCRVLIAQGRYAEALNESERCLAAVAAFPQQRAIIYSYRARALLGTRQVSEALSTIRQAMAILEEVGSLEYGEESLRLTHGEVLQATGLDAEAHHAIVAARAHLLRRAQRIRNPVWRDSFLRDVEDNRRTLALADAMHRDDVST